ncbi:Hypothetical predicted protein [Olea europaea subsp. europaea]|uniref:Uncharacterized protein n=1 Tax=Olea europaea subsp. europaea TaxID=158383 RepID=A0A8S0R9X0_OLEEU|nr:Hypothetical predicted protein [Olea europaea subsp. europaea]
MELAQQSRGPNQGHLATCYVNNELLLGGRQQDLVELVLCEERALVDCLLCVMEVQEEEEDDEDEDKELPDKEHKEGRDNKFVAVAGVVFVWTCYVILPPLVGRCTISITIVCPFVHLARLHVSVCVCMHESEAAAARPASSSGGGKRQKREREREHESSSPNVSRESRGSLALCQCAQSVSRHSIAHRRQLRREIKPHS